MRTLLFGLACVLALPGALAQEAGQAWNFSVYLNDSPIGAHRFTLRGAGAERELTSEANFAVKFIGITAFRYEHRAVENWNGNCLTRMTASTNDDGTKLAVNAALEGDRLAISATGGKESAPACAMSFAYWNPAMLKQSRLLNAQTGKYEAVNITATGEESILVNGKPVMAKRYHLTGPKNPLDLYYGANGEWLGLASAIDGRKLSYRLDAGN